jgi:hypothetical protein
MDGFGLYAVVKETGVDDVGLTEFMTQYFPQQSVYLDSELAYYRALGNRSISLMKLIYDMMFHGITQRLKSKDVVGNLAGEGLKKGGIVIFDRNGKPRFSYVEETGKDIPVTDFVAALNAIRAEK